MVYVPKHRRLFALVLIAATDIVFSLLPIKGFDAADVALVFSMLLAVAVSFLFSAFSHFVKFERVLYKYGVSGGIGIIVGAAAYFVLKGFDLLSLDWFNTEGKIFFVVLNLVAATYLFFSKRA